MQSPGPAAYAPTLQAPPLTGPDGTKVMANRLVGSLDDAGEGHHGPLEPGSVIKKRFVLETLLGKGGMGIVFGAIDRRKEEARDPNPRVALKVLNADFQRHPQAFMALQREARKAQTLAHPNVVTVFDFDRDGEAVYMTMELLHGRSLDSMTREARGKGVKREIALPIIRGIAEGLAYAHRKGIVHSDLKPGNVFVAEDGTPKILDFGIARAVPSMNTEASRDVFDAGSLGAYTEAYATDEMIDGVDPHPADDMYALGIIAYELLTGFHPYQRHSAPGARKLGLKPPPLKGLKRKEMRAIERCLSLERKKRPQNAAEFLKLFRGVTDAAEGDARGCGGAVARGRAISTTSTTWRRAPRFRSTSCRAKRRRCSARRWRKATSSGASTSASTRPTRAINAVDLYGQAYAIHPRNREAVAALKKSADSLLAIPNLDEKMRQALAKDLQTKSSFYEKYAPVVDAVRE